MSEHRIPNRADAGIQFLGVDVIDAAPAIIGVFIALMFGGALGWGAYLIFPVGGWAMSKLWMGWKKHNPSGHLSAILYAFGIAGYSDAFDRKNKLFVGNSETINPARNRLFDIKKGQ